MERKTTLAAARLKRPSWKDPRLLIGLLLVLLSVSGVIGLVGSADRTVQVYAAKSAIAVGQSLTMEDLAVVNVRLDAVEPAYVTVADGLAKDKVALQRIEKGQLVPEKSLGRAEALDRKPVAIPVDGELPEQVVPGTKVDVWVALPDSGRGYKEPVLLLPGAEVSQLTPGSNTLGSAKATVVLVLVNNQQMPRLLGSLANAAKVSVVWNPSGRAQ
ncbi:SAF domain-containing protein [Paenarthrobacter sp. S56]|uniref:SAF domain-containing protein n=1 Tax=Paenarthrobacter sp. S56 TaxID=3138179 RepID=UPI00321B0229